MCSAMMAKSMWSARNATLPGDGVGAARTSCADSLYALRNVRWTIAISRTSIGCDTDIYPAPRALSLAGGPCPSTTRTSLSQAAQDRLNWNPALRSAGMGAPSGRRIRFAGIRLRMIRTSLPTVLPPSLRVGDAEGIGGAGGQGRPAADREGGERVGVAEVDVGEHGQASEAILTGDDLLQQGAGHAARFLEAADHQALHPGGIGELKQGSQVPGERVGVAGGVVLDHEQRPAE